VRRTVRERGFLSTRGLTYFSSFSSSRRRACDIANCVYFTALLVRASSGLRFPQNVRRRTLAAAIGRSAAREEDTKGEKTAVIERRTEKENGIGA